MEFRLISTFLLLLCAGATGMWASGVPENPDDDYVTASVMIASPGKELYSTLGHAFIRMQCPSHNMDYCFTYESDDVKAKVLSFLSGNLKMGMMGIATEEFLSHYADEGREVTEYRLNLPIRAKQNLWRLLDEMVDEGMNLPYDYMERGCALSVFSVINRAAGYGNIETGEWPEDFRMTRREIVCSQLDSHPWTRLFLNIITNGPIDDEVDNSLKVITPRNLVQVLEQARYDGRPLVSAGETVLPLKAQTGRQIFTPMLFAVLLLVLAMAGWMGGKNFMLYPILAIQTFLGVVTVYLVFFSNLCATEWSWLIVPFNPLAAICWKWRRYWEIPYALLIAIWAIVIFFGGSYLTDPPLIITALAAASTYCADRIKSPAICLRNPLLKLNFKKA